MRSPGENPSSIELDDILLELGATGKYQIRNNVMLMIPMIASAFYTLSYVFTTLNPQYRCLVPQCENNINTVYIPEWLKNAVPFTGNLPKKCERYQFDKFANGSVENEYCPAKWFNQDVEQSCPVSELFFKTKFTSIAKDFKIICADTWKLSFPGTIHNVGQFIGMPITGMFSDRFGRKLTLIFCILSSAICGIIRSLSPTYAVFVIFEFLDAMLGAATYISAFILATEFVRPEKRVIASTLLFCAFPVGEVIMGIIAWSVLDWRKLLLWMYIPGLVIAAYLYLLPESVRWLISKGRHGDAKALLENAAKVNGLTLSTQAFYSLETNVKIENEMSRAPCDVNFKNMFARKKMLFRFIICAIFWITSIFVFFGLSLNSVEIAGNLYLNYILVSFAEIPGNLANLFFLDRFGRRYTLCGAFLLSGVSCLSFIFIPSSGVTLKLMCFLIGKSAIAMSVSSLYVYTAELFPTPLRQTTASLCSMFGRFGSMVAPQMPLLADLIWVNFPLLSFGVASVVAGLLVLTLPETVNIKLPDTIEEAVNIGGNKNVTEYNTSRKLK